LKVLKQREICVQQIAAKAKNYLAEISKPGETYTNLLKLLITQAMVKMGEAKVVVRCRREDKEMVEEVLETAMRDYHLKTGATCEALLDSRHFLPSGPVEGVENVGQFCFGGVILSAHDDRILCSNTLETRLNQSLEQLLPEIRKTLFGSIQPLTRIFTTL